ncbi:MAG: sulfatase-like hydrolase/transferase [Gemmatimonadales bacterium]|nr:sulfatase-like hydrolase/transferase [Gemmatimonadales bacterium]
MKRRDFVASTGAALAGAAVLPRELLARMVQGADRPNVLWITCEDLSPHLGCYGDTYARTPNLDRVASEGVRYERAFATAPVCTPARSCLITGIFATTLGTEHLRGVQPLSPTVRCFTEYLRDAGYYCSNNVKEDYNFAAPAAWDESSNTAHWRGRREGQPFFSVFNLMTTHQSQTRYVGDELRERIAAMPPAQQFDPATVPIPPFYPDTPLVRENLAAFYTQVSVMDRQVQDRLDELEEDGLADDTIVFFYSDHGDGLPRGKRWLHDSGLRVPLIVRFPPKYRHLAPAPPGGVVDRLVSFVDFGPTVLSIAGIATPDAIQGAAFLGDHAGEPRQYVVATRDRVDEVLETSRAIRDERYKYIRNFLPHRPRMQRSFYSELTPIRQEIRRLHAEGALSGTAAYLMAPTIPPEELYDTREDPDELNNLAGDEAHRDTLLRLRRALFDWMLESRDTGLLPESDLLARAEGRMPIEVTGSDAIYPVARILETADLAGRGVSPLPQLLEALADEDAAVRYWGATGLAALGGDAAPAVPALRLRLQDESPAVRLAAAEVMCRLGYEDVGLPVLAAGLEHDDITVQLHAAQVLLVIGEKARPIIQEMRAAIQRSEGLQDHGWYLREALLYLVGVLETT